VIPRETIQQEAHLFLRFGVVGTVGFLVDLSILETGLALGLDHFVARFISIMVALQVTFLANGLLVFKHGTPDQLLTRWPHYMLSSGFSVACNYTIYLALIHSGLRYLSLSVVAVVIATGITMFISFTGARRFAFRRSSSPDGT
jgi:putative flippase GtrA